MFYGPATPRQFENLLVWRKRPRVQASEMPELPEPRREDEGVSQDSIDLYELSVGRTSGR